MIDSGRNLLTHQKNDPKPSILEQEITAHISKALRADFTNIRALESKLAQQVEIKTETLKKWYYGCNAPSAAHLILLARSSPAVEEVLKNLIAKDTP